MFFNLKLKSRRVFLDKNYHRVIFIQKHSPTFDIQIKNTKVMLKKILGFAPKLESDGSYSPSKMALKMGVSDTTDFENISYQKYQGQKSKVLVIFTEEKNLKMKWPKESVPRNNLLFWDKF